MSDIDKGTWYQSAVSGLWYENANAAGHICAIRCNGVTEYVGEHAFAEFGILQSQLSEYHKQLQEAREV